PRRPAASRAAPCSRCGAAWASWTGPRGRADAAFPPADGRDVPLGAVPAARSRDAVRRRDRPRAGAGRQACRPADAHRDLHRLGLVHEAVGHARRRDRRPHPHRGADRHRRRLHRGRHHPARARRGRRPHQRGDHLGGRGDRRRPRRRLLLGGGRHHNAGPAGAAGAGARRATRRAAIHAGHVVDSRPPRPDGARGPRDRRAPHRARHRAAGEPPRERRRGDRLHVAGAEAAARRGDDRPAPSPQRADGLDGRVTRRLVVDLASPRAAWRVPGTAVAAIRAALGRGWEVVEVAAPAASDNDGGSGTPEAAAAARGAEIYLGYGVPAGVVAAGRGTLRWAHSGTAGIGATLPHLAGSGIVLTNSAAVHAEPIADWAIAAIAYFARGLDRMREFQAIERWARAEFADRAVAVRELGELRLGVFGLGGVGGGSAHRGLALGMGVARGRRRPKRGGPSGAGGVGGSPDLPRLAAESDAFVIAAPHTTATRGAVTREVLERLPEGAVVVNVSRGTLLDETALLDLLD